MKDNDPHNNPHDNANDFEAARNEGERAKAEPSSAPDMRGMLRRNIWLIIALGLVALGMILFAAGHSARGGLMGSALVIEDGSLRFHLVAPNVPEETTFVEIHDGARFTDIHISALAASIVVVPVSPGAPSGVTFRNLNPGVREDGNRLVIDTRSYEGGTRIDIFNFGFGVSTARREIELRIPLEQVDYVTIVNSAGSVRIEGVSVDSLSVRSTSGSVRLDDLQAQTLEVTGSSGSIRANNIAFANGTIRTTSGSLTMNDARWDNLNANITSGSIRIAGASISDGATDGSTDLRSVSGSVNLEVRGNRNDFRYSLSATSGSVRVDGGRFDRRAVGGGGAHPITINTTSGSIRLDFDR